MRFLWRAALPLIFANLAAFLAAPLPSAEPAPEQLERRFREEIQPLLKTYCLSCHGAEKQEAKLNLSGYQSLAAVAKDQRVWELVRQRLEAGEMPPEDAPRSWHRMAPRGNHLDRKLAGV